MYGRPDVHACACVCMCVCMDGRELAVTRAHTHTHTHTCTRRFRVKERYLEEFGGCYKFKQGMASEVVITETVEREGSPISYKTKEEFLYALKILINNVVAVVVYSIAVFRCSGVDESVCIVAVTLEFGVAVAIVVRGIFTGQFDT